MHNKNACVISAMFQLRSLSGVTIRKINLLSLYGIFLNSVLIFVCMGGSLRQAERKSVSVSILSWFLGVVEKNIPVSLRGLSDLFQRW